MYLGAGVGTIYLGGEWALDGGAAMGRGLGSGIGIGLGGAWVINWTGGEGGLVGAGGAGGRCVDGWAGREGCLTGAGGAGGWMVGAGRWGREIAGAAGSVVMGGREIAGPAVEMVFGECAGADGPAGAGVVAFVCARVGR